MYPFWNYPIDKSIFDYVNSPREWLSNTSTIQAFLLLIICLSLYILFWFIVFKKFLARNIKVLKPGWSSLILILLPFSLLILPVQCKTGMNHANNGSIYFYRNDLLNHATINPIWNLFYSISERNHLTEQFNFISEAEAISVHDSLYPVDRSFPCLLTNNRPNIVIIMLESFASSIIAESGGNPKVTPNFNSLTEEGIFFRNFYATGAMTDRGLAGLVSGFPALPGDCIILHPKKTHTLPFISKDLRSAGYSATFLYGGDVNFANTKSYLITGDFDRIISNNDDHFSSSIERSKWGVPDEFVFERLFEECNQLKDPFFILCMTLSNHNPFDVPMEPVFPGNSYQELFFNSAYYSDKCMGEFISKAKSTEWYKNTLFVLVADHGTRIENENEFDLKRFKIPMLWIGGALSKKGIRIDKLGSQVDIPITLLNQLGLSSNFPFAKDLLSDESNSFAFYTYNEGFGFITDSSAYIYDHKLKESVLKEGKDPDSAEKNGKAYLQVLFDDYFKR